MCLFAPGNLAQKQNKFVGFSKHCKHSNNTNWCEHFTIIFMLLKLWFIWNIDKCRYINGGGRGGEVVIILRI